MGLLLFSPELTEKVRRDGIVKEEMFSTAFNKKVFSVLLEIAQEDGTVEEGLLAAHFTPEEVGRITGMKIRRVGLTHNGEQVLKECVQRLEQAKTKGNNIEDIESILGTKRRKKNE